MNTSGKKGRDRSKVRRPSLRHKLVYGLMHWISPLLLRKYGFHTDVMHKTKEPIIVMANHLTEVDMFVLASAFPKQMTFVAGEHLLRSKHGAIIKWANDPIYEYKGSVAIETVKEVIRRAKAGSNIAIFPEGNRSFNGETRKLRESTAKLVKMSGSGLVTYRIQGGYFIAPRWASTFRTGPMEGHIVRYYTSEEISHMKASDLTEAINNDLYENAYERQRVEMHPYHGERLAEGMENYLVKCSHCGAMDSMVTKDDRFTCSVCGQTGTITEEGFLKGEGLGFDNVHDWGVWSEQETEKLIMESDMESPVFRDNDVALFEITDDHRKVDLLRGSVVGYRDRIEMGDRVFHLQDMPYSEMLYFGKTLLFDCGGEHFGITGERFHAIKYQKLHNIFKASRKQMEQRG